MTSCNLELVESQRIATLQRYLVEVIVNSSDLNMDRVSDQYDLVSVDTCQQKCKCEKLFRPWETSPNVPQQPGNVTRHEINTSIESIIKFSALYPRETGRRTKKLLNPAAVQLMENWYIVNVDHPYPNESTVEYFVKHGQITPNQVRKWMANKRVRSNNTLTFNGAVHPKKLKRLLPKQDPLKNKSFHPYMKSPLKNTYEHRPLKSFSAPKSIYAISPVLYSPFITYTRPQVIY